MVLLTNVYVGLIAENYIAYCIAENIHQLNAKLSSVTLLVIVKI